MAFKLPPLPYGTDALQPHLSAWTLECHHGRHHRKYVDKLNELVAGTPFERQSLTAIILATFGDDRKAQVKIFENAAQVWNHGFFWTCMRPRGGGSPTGPLAQGIDQAFGGLEEFKQSFKKAAAGQFGSGYAWLVADHGKLMVRSTPNAVAPMVDGQSALLTCDVWEHAYYLDYQDRRADFVQNFLEHLVNWDFVAERLSAANAEPEPKRAANR